MAVKIKKRKPAGAAVPGAVERPVNYPATVIALTTDEMKAAVVAEAKVRGVSQGAIAREWLELGRAAYAAERGE